MLCQSALARLNASGHSDLPEPTSAAFVVRVPLLFVRSAEQEVCLVSWSRRPGVVPAKP